MFDAQVRGVVRALKGLYPDGDSQVSVIVNTWGSNTNGSLSGPVIVLNNVLWRGDVQPWIDVVARLTVAIARDPSGACTTEYGYGLAGYTSSCLFPSDARWAAQVAASKLSHPNGRICLASGWGNGSPAWWGATPNIRFPSALTDAVANGTLADINVLSFAGTTAYEQKDLRVFGYADPVRGYLFQVKGRPMQDGVATAKVLCPAYAGKPSIADEIQIPVPTTLPTPNGSGRANSPSDIAKTISSATRDWFYAHACEQADGPCTTGYPEEIESAGPLFWVPTDENNANQGRRALRHCSVNVDTSNVPGVRIGVTAPIVDFFGAVVSEDERQKGFTLYGQADSLRSWGPLVNLTGGHFTIAGSPGKSTTPQQLEDAVASCFTRTSLRGIEVTQGIQSWKNDIPLIAGKPTFARVFLESNTENLLPPVLRAYRTSNCVGATCQREPIPIPTRPGEAGVQYDLAPARAAKANYTDAVLQRGVFGKNPDHVFELPSQWTSGELELEIALPDARLDCYDAVSQAPSDCTIRVGFDGRTQLQALNVTPVYLQWDPRFTPNNDDVEKSRQQISQMLPIASLSEQPPRTLVLDLSQSNIRAPSSLPGPDKSDDPLYESWKTFSSQLIHRVALPTLIWAKAWECSLSPERCTQSGILRGLLSSPGELGGEGAIGLAASVQNFCSPYSRGSKTCGFVAEGGAHEVIHTLGRGHSPYCMKIDNVDPCTTFPHDHEYPGTGSEGADWENSGLRPALGVAHLLQDPSSGKMVPLAEPDLDVWGTRGPFGSRPAAVDPYKSADIMSYCGEMQNVGRWVSDFTYTRLINLITAFNGGDADVSAACPGLSVLDERSVTLACAPFPGEQVYPSCTVSDPQEQFFIRGVVNSDDFQLSKEDPVELKALLTAPARAGFEGTQPAQPGDVFVLVQLQDESGTVLDQKEAQIFVLGGDDPTEGTHFAFLSSLPAREDASRISISVEGVEIASTSASDNAPVLGLNQPNVSGEDLLVGWTASDVDGDELTYLVEYSADGSNWDVLAMDYPSTSLQLAHDHLAGSASAVVRITANDGFHSVTKVSNSFTVPRKGPVVLVDSPVADGLMPRYVGNQLVVFSAHAVDQEDGPLTEAALSWRSDRDGLLGTGTVEVLARSLTGGVHQITLQATDSDGQSASTTFNIEVMSSGTTDSSADLTMSLGGQTEVEAGSVATVTVEVKNRGRAATASPFEVDLFVPSDLRLGSMQDENWSCSASGQLYSCTWGGASLEVGGSVILPVNILAPSNQFVDTKYELRGQLTYGGDAQPLDNSASAELLVHAASLPVLESVAPAPTQVFEGDDIAFPIDLKQTAGGDAASIVVDATLSQSGVSFTAGAGEGWTCGVSAPQHLVCGYEQSVQAGTSVPGLEVLVHNSNPDIRSIAFSYTVWASTGATASPAQQQPTTSGSVTADPTPVIRSPGVDLAVQAGNPCAFSKPTTIYLPGGTQVFPACTEATFPHIMRGGLVGEGTAALVPGKGSYTTDIQVQNVGSDPASGTVLITMYAPFGTTLMGAVGPSQYGGLPSWACTRSTRQFDTDPDYATCQFAAAGLKPGDTLPTIHVSFWLNDNVPQQIAPSVTMAFADANLSNNQASYALNIPRGVLVVPQSTTPMTGKLVLSSGTPTTGSTVIATATVTNGGASAITASTVRLSAFGAPALVEVLQVSGAGWSCTNTWGQTTCQYTGAVALNPGQSLPAVTATLRVGSRPGLMEVPLSVWNGTTTALNTTASLDVQAGASLLSAGELSFAGCLGSSADCNPKVGWPSTNALPPYGSRIYSLNFPSLALDRMPGGTTTLYWESAPTWSPDGWFVSRSDDLQFQLYSPKGAVYWSATLPGSVARGATTSYGNGGASSLSISSETYGSGTVTSIALPVEAVSFGPSGWLARAASSAIRLRRLTTAGRLMGISTETILASSITGLRNVAWSPDGLTLAYTAGTAGQEKIWLLPLTSSGSAYSVGGTATRLSSDGTTRYERDPAWSPDGTRLAFTASGDLKLINANGQSEQLVRTCGTTQPCTHPTWSADGQWLAFQLGVADPAIYVRNLSTGVEALVARGRDPAFVPNKNAIQPVADTMRTAYRRPVTLNVLTNDPGTGLQVTRIDSPQRGSASCDASGNCTYTPGSLTLGTDTFSYHVRDALSREGVGIVTVTIDGEAPSVQITSPAAQSALDVAQTVTVQGSVRLDQVTPVDPGAPNGGALFLVDLVTDRQYYYATPSTPPRPAPWAARPVPPALDLCADDSSTFNLVDCYVQTLTQSLSDRSDTRVGAIVFGQDYGFGTTGSDYRANVGAIDLSPAAGNQWFVAPEFDGNGNGRADLPEMVRWVHTTQSWGQCTGTVPGCANGHPTRGGLPIGYGGEFFAPEWRAGAGPTYDHLLDRMNTTFAQNGSSSRNVAYLFTAGTTAVSTDPESPLMRAVAAGTVVHAFVPPAHLFPVDIYVAVSNASTMGEEQPAIKALVAGLANALIASPLDFRVIQTGTTDYFAATVLAGDPRYVFASAGNVPGRPDTASFGIAIGDQTYAGTHASGVTSSTSVGGPEVNRSIIIGSPFMKPPSLTLDTTAGGMTGVAPGTTACATASAPFATWSSTSGFWADGFPWAPQQFVSICDSDWSRVIDWILETDFGTHWTCDHADSPIRKITDATGGTCRDLTWAKEELEAPLPPVVEIDEPDVVADKIDHIDVSFGNGATVRATVHPDGTWEAVLPNPPTGSSTIQAHLFTTEGWDATDSHIVNGIGSASNHAPTPADDLVLLPWSTAGAGDVTAQVNVLANDRDPDGDTLTVLSVTQPKTGSVSCVDGLCTYRVPKGTQITSDLFSYTVADRFSITATAKAVVQMDTNHPPVASNSTRTVYADEDNYFDLNFLGNDPDNSPLTFAIVPVSGGPVITCTGTMCNYHPPTGTSGVVTSSFRVSDGTYTALGVLTFNVLSRGYLSAVFRAGERWGQVDQGGLLWLDVTNDGEAPLDHPRVTVQLSSGLLPYDHLTDWDCDFSSSPRVECTYQYALTPGDTEILGLYVYTQATAAPWASVRAYSDDRDIAQFETPVVVPAAGAFDLSIREEQTTEHCQLGLHRIELINHALALVPPLLLTGNVGSAAKIESLVLDSENDWSCTHDATSYRCALLRDLSAQGSSVGLSVRLRQDQVTVAPMHRVNLQQTSGPLLAFPTLSAVQPLWQSKSNTEKTFVPQGLTAQPAGTQTGAVSFGACATARGYLTLDLSDVASDAQVATATLVLQGTKTCGTADQQPTLLPVLGSVDASSLGYETTPGADVEGALPTTGDFFGTDGLQVDVTDLLRRWQREHVSHGTIEVRADDFGGSVDLASTGLYVSYSLDADDDGVLSCADNCAYQANPDQADTDHDGVGDVCEPNPRDLALAVAPQEIDANGNLTFALSVQNDDSALAETGGIRLDGTLAPGLSLTNIHGDGWSCAIGPVPFCKFLEVLEPGETAPVLWISAHLDPQDTGRKAYSFVVGYEEGDPDPTNNHVEGTVSELGSSDLSLALSGATAASVAGAASFTATVVNQGTGTAPAPRVAIALPAGFVLQSVDAAGWSCTADAMLDCVLGSDLAPGAVAPPIMFVVRVQEAAYPQAELMATAMTENDVDPTNDSAALQITVDGVRDVALATTHAGAFEVGAMAQYTLQLANAGTLTTAGSVTVHELLPRGLSVVNVVASNWGCSYSASELSCTLGLPIKPGELASPITVQVAVGAAAYPTVTHTASVSSDGDRVSANDVASETIGVIGHVDVALAKSHVGDFDVEATGSYALTVQNMGDVATPVPMYLRDVLPTGLAFVAASANGWACAENGGIVECQSDHALPPGGSAETITLTVLAGEAAYGTVVNTASVIAPGDGNPSNDEAADPTVVHGVVDASLSLARTDALVVGQTATYTTLVQNLGTISAGSVQVHHSVPPGLTVVGTSGTGWSCSASIDLTCSFAGVIAPHTAAPALSVLVRPEVNAADSVTWTATVSAPGDVLASNNTATDQGIVTGIIDVAVTKMHTGTFSVGALGTYTIAVANVGNRRAPGPITVVDSLPSGLTFAAASGTSWSCNTASGQITCSYPNSLMPGESAPGVSVNVLATEQALGTVTNVVRVSAPEDVNSKNDVAQDPTLVTGFLDAGISITRKGNLLAGQQVDYDLAVTNLGTLTIRTPVAVRAAVPGGMSLTAYTGNGWTCTTSSTAVECTYAAALSPGETTPLLSWNMLVDTNAPGSITLTVFLSVQNDQRPANDTASETGSVTPAPPQRRVVLWPPNHKMSTVSLSACVATYANCPGPVTGAFRWASSDEAADAPGSGDNQQVDVTWSGCDNAQVRAERAGSGDGRVYQLGYAAIDSCGDHLVGSCRVEVPHDRSDAAATLGTEAYRIGPPSGCAP